MTQYNKVNPPPKCRVMTIEFAVEIDNIINSGDEDDLLERLREYGVAEIVSTEWVLDTLTECDNKMKQAKRVNNN